MTDQQLLAEITGRLSNRMPDLPPSRIFVLAVSVLNAGVDNEVALERIFSALECEPAPTYDELVGPPSVLDMFHIA